MPYQREFDVEGVTASLHLRTGGPMFRLSVVLVTIIVSLPTAAPAAGENALSNGTFDVDVAGWTAVADATIEWNSIDADGDPNSGCAMVANIANYSTTMGARQCSAVLEGDRDFVLRTMVYVPSGQPATGYGYITIRLYDEPNCQGNEVYANYSSLVFTATPDQWLESSLLLTAPPGSQSALVWLTIHKNEDPDSLTMAFDNVSLFAIEIFADGFEGGNTSAWSNTLP